MEVVEIYPHILVYKNMFKDISKCYDVLTDSLLETEDRLFSSWTPWSVFGEYMNPIIPNMSISGKYGNIKDILVTTENQKKQKELIVEMLENFHLATEHYINKYNVDVDINSKSIDKYGVEVPTWRWYGGTIAKYHQSDESKKFGMMYHSDYMREQADEPGYKFVITCTIYFNDNYEGGEIDFAMGNKLIKYKPEAGDLLVFPSGHPEYLTENDMPYLHAVTPSYNNNKFLSRMYWQKYQDGTDDWYAKEKEYGKDVWASMQPELREKFIQEHPQRKIIEDGVRLQ